MSRFLFTADLHLTTRARDEYRWEFLKWLRSKAVKYSIDMVFLLGDLTDQKDKHSADLVNRLIEDLDALCEVTEVLMLKGNHDYLGDPDIPFFGFLTNFITDIQDVEIGGYRFLLVPHQPNWEVQVEPDCYDFVLCHQAFSGSILDSGIVLGRGVRPDFPDGCQVIAGDVHIPQLVGDSVLYCGAPYPINFGDGYNPRVLYWDGRKLKSLRHRAIHKHMIDIHAKDKVLEELQEVRLQHGDQVKLRVHLPRTEYHRWRDIKKAARAWVKKYKAELYGLQLVPVEKPQSKSAAPKAQACEGPEDLYRAFCKQQGVKKRLRRVGEELMGWIS